MTVGAAGCGGGSAASGYTNGTRVVAGHLIEKTFQGGERDRWERERRCLTGLTGQLPVPEAVRYDERKPRSQCEGSPEPTVRT